MKIAYIILAHKNPAQVARLVNRLNTENVLFSIHIDAASDLNAYKEQMQIFNPDSNNIYFLENRYRVRWGGFNTVKAEVELIRFVIRFNPECIVFLSGQDYPIKSNANLEKYFKQYEGQFIIEYQLVDLKKPNRIVHYCFADYFDYKKEFFQKKNIPVLIRAFNKIIPKRKMLNGIIPYEGRVQFVMPLDIAKYVVEEYMNNKALKNFYKYVLLGDEQYFHTMLMNSKYADRTYNITTHFADYTSHHPIVWKSKDIEYLKKQENIFARKFDILIDEEILNLIDKEILFKN